MTSSNPISVYDSEFCHCGAILPLPDEQLFVQCYLCHAKWQTKEVHDRLVSVHHENYVTNADVQSQATQGQADGPEVERNCSHCGHNRMTYSTRQTRSADEGMTVFFKCMKCAKQDIEYS